MPANRPAHRSPAGPAGTGGHLGVLSSAAANFSLPAAAAHCSLSTESLHQRAKVFANRGNDAFPLSELQAAVLVPQLDRLAERHLRRAAAAARLSAALDDVPSLDVLPSLPDDLRPAFYKFGLRFRPPAGTDTSNQNVSARDDFIAAAQAAGLPLDAGFRGFARRSARRCRTVGGPQARPRRCRKHPASAPSRPARNGRYHRPTCRRNRPRCHIRLDKERTATTTMKLLLTNDDGIDAPGLTALARAVEAYATRHVVVAPHQQHSGCGHQVTTRRPLKLQPHEHEEYNDDWHALHGTPVDCTRVGLLHLEPETDWVIAGINAGGNLGVDVYTSGTVAAVREAALLGRPAIAISQYVRRDVALDWGRSAACAAEVIRQLTALPHTAGDYYCVNLPVPSGESTAVPDVVHCPLDANPMPVAFHHEDGHLHYRGVYQDRVRTPGADVDVCFFRSYRRDTPLRGHGIGSHQRQHSHLTVRPS